MVPCILKLSSIIHLQYEPGWVCRPIPMLHCQLGDIGREMAEAEALTTPTAMPVHVRDPASS